MPRINRYLLGCNAPRMDNGGMESGNVRRRSAKSTQNTFQYHVRLAGGTTHIRSYEVSWLLFEILRLGP